MSEDPVTIDELAEKADKYLHEASLTPEEYEALKQSVSELTPIFSSENSYFVLGSYGKPEIRRLQLVKDRLNRQPGAYAFLMVDIRSEWTNTYLKFRLLADHTDIIVGVAEHAQGGFLVEQGYFTALEEYFAKTHVFKREYDTLDLEHVDTGVTSKNPYSGMQTAIFEMLDDAGRLCQWTSEDDLVECVDTL
ncbi:hypothetical protein [Halanaeroarchaeum sulfurireducens]|uniref:Uncharacterized protein n=1 Tax=Halanaeroarchaeum sulfurireducens TaxID=1604004 RepID=A0A0F7PDK2_9EURY|nr:hypothetical protein [Halanaeroarchaeum sulfurireducens]AKH98742.1 hypothetical protein HLASF_3116 [Halanaeroarchaeum sulfurireducens]ALG83186.1 hypothetical protein HLASA_3118 [Halanaeroarchaeum sulfurireducens]